MFSEMQFRGLILGLLAIFPVASSSPVLDLPDSTLHLPSLNPSNLTHSYNTTASPPQLSIRDNILKGVNQVREDPKLKKEGTPRLWKVSLFYPNNAYISDAAILPSDIELQMILELEKDYFLLTKATEPVWGEWHDHYDQGERPISRGDFPTFAWKKVPLDYATAVELIQDTAGKDIAWNRVDCKRSIVNGTNQVAWVFSTSRREPSKLVRLNLEVGVSTRVVQWVRVHIPPDQSGSELTL